METFVGSMQASTKNQIKLPNIFGTSNSPTFNNSNFTDLNKFSETVNNVEKKFNSSENFDSNLNDAKNEFIKLIVNTLMNNNDKEWQTLSEALDALKPVSSLFENDRRISHYVERIYSYVTRSSDREICRLVYRKIEDLFPNPVNDVKFTNNVAKSMYELQTSEKPEKLNNSLVPSPRIDFFKGKQNPYKNKLKDIRYRPKDPPTVGDLAILMPKVTYESFKFESNWKEKLSALTLTSALDLEELKEEPDSGLIVAKPKKLNKEKLFSIKTETDQDPVFDIEYNAAVYQKPVPEFEEKCLNLTGREMIFHLLEATHLGNAVSYYLNIKDNKYFRPYDLITVPQSKKNPEYYIFSVFGVLHVVPDDGNEQLTLTEWNRYAVLWDACSKIKFFKQFLFRKFFIRWMKNAKFSKFLKLKNSISKDILLAIPFYSDALVLVSKLIQEVSDLQFLPRDQTKVDLVKEFLEKNFASNTTASMQSSRSSRNSNNTQELIERANRRKKELLKETYSLDKFAKSLDEIHTKSDQVLKYFFVYVKSIVDHTRQKIYDKLRFYEKLSRVDSESERGNKSMSVQKSVRLKREAELKKTRHQINLIGNFVDLVGAILGTSMLQVCRLETKRFVDEFVECMLVKREPLYEAELGFDKSDNLVMIPNKEKFVDVIMSSVNRMEMSIINASQILDFEGVIRDVEKYGHKINKPKKLTNKDEEEENEETLLEKDPEAYCAKLLSEERDDLPVKKPILKHDKDYDEKWLDTKYMIAKTESSLKVDNFLIKANSQPLKPISISSVLGTDSELQQFKLKIFSYLTEASDEIGAYCAENEWIAEIKRYISKYSAKLVLEWKNVGFYEIEDQLNKIRNWIENVKTNVDKTIITSNKLLKIDCRPVENLLVPRLEAIYAETCECVLKEYFKDTLSFIDFLKKVIVELRGKPKDIEEFANYAKIVMKHKSSIASYEARMNSNKSLLEVVRINYRALSTEEEQLDTQAQDLWKSFMFIMQETVELVNIQSPSILEQLTGLYRKYTDELRRIHLNGTTGKYLDPDEDSTPVLDELKTLCYEFAGVEKILRQCALWREAITTHAEDLSFVARLSDQLNTRKELWKYFEVTFQHIKDWKNTCVKKVNVRKIEEKLVFWEEEAKKLSKHLAAEDKVWFNWWNSIQSFKMIMKWVGKLANDSLKPEHFEELFAAIGLVVDKHKSYTIQELIDLKFDDYVDLIFSINKRAVAELSNVQQFQQITELWNNKIKFKLAKNFPIKLFNSEKFELLKPSSSLSIHTTSSNRIKELREMSKQQMDEQSSLMAQVSYKLVDINEIKYHVDDSLIKLNIILCSQINPATKESVHEWISKLSQLIQMCELWMQVQHKWLFLERVFASNDNDLRLIEEMMAYNLIIKDFKEFQFKIVDDPLVLNILREDSNKAKLQNWLFKFSKVCNDLDSEIEKACVEFPRFYYLDKEHLLEMLSHSRDCRKYLETVRKCFHGVKDLVYALPSKKEAVSGVQAKTTSRTMNRNEPDESMKNQSSALDFDIYANELEVVGIVGCGGKERLDFFAPLRSYDLQKPAEWFDNLMKIIKSSVCKHTQAYLDTLEDYDYTNVPLLTRRLESFREIPTQCVILGEASFWSRNVSRIIENKQFQELNLISSYFEKSIGELSSAQVASLDSGVKEIYSKVILWMIFTRDLTQELAEVKSLNEFSFEWMRVLKYNYEKKVLLKNEENELTNRSVKLENKYENLTLIQMTSEISYDYEYMDMSNQLVLNPVTERCFLNLTAAVNSLKCGTIVGPSSSGKSQTIHLLALACGQYLQEINCNELMTSELVTRYLKGLVGSGSWALFNRVDTLQPSVLSSISYQLEYLRNSIRSLLEKDPSQVNTKGQERNCGLKSYFEEPYTESQVFHDLNKPLKISQLKLKDEEIRKINEMINYGQNKPDSLYQRKFLGYVKFQGRLVKANVNYACFFTANSVHSLPENLKNNLRVCSIIEPDFKYITKALMIANGLNQGSANVDSLSEKLIDFLKQLPLLIPNEFNKNNSKNLNTISKIIKMAATKHKQDKGRQERTICLVLSCFYATCLKTAEEKSLLNALMKRIFDYEASNVFEELLSSIIKEQLNLDGFKINSKQIQKVHKFL